MNPIQTDDGPILPEQPPTAVTHDGDFTTTAGQTLAALERSETIPLIGTTQEREITRALADLDTAAKIARHAESAAVRESLDLSKHTGRLAPLQDAPRLLRVRRARRALARVVSRSVWVATLRNDLSIAANALRVAEVRVRGHLADLDIVVATINTSPHRDRDDVRSRLAELAETYVIASAAVGAAELLTAQCSARELAMTQCIDAARRVTDGALWVGWF